MKPTDEQRKAQVLAALRKATMWYKATTVGRKSSLDLTVAVRILAGLVHDGVVDARSMQGEVRYALASRARTLSTKRLGTARTTVPALKRTSYVDTDDRP